ncbi:MAG: hypothetical protein R2932_33720 [Caldilineaceae bacterium]
MWLGDFDGDGAADLAVAGFAANSAIARIYRNSGCAQLRLTEDNLTGAVVAGIACVIDSCCTTTGPSARWA